MLLLLPRSHTHTVRVVFFSLSLSICAYFTKIFAAENERTLQKKEEKLSKRFFFFFFFFFLSSLLYTHAHASKKNNGREQKRDAHHAQAAAQAALVLLFDGVRDVLRVPLPKPIGCD